MFLPLTIEMHQIALTVLTLVTQSIPQFVKSHNTHFFSTDGHFF